MNSFSSTLAANPEYYNETLDLIQLSFLYTEDQSYEVDFYPLMEPSNHKNNHILIMDKKIVGHIGVQLRPLGWTGFQVPTALLGGIAIHPKYRGRGLLKKFLNEIIEHYENQVCFFLLWSQLDQIYKQFNFYQAGGQFQTGKSNLEDVEEFEKTKFTNLSAKEFEQIQSLYKSSIAEYFTNFIRSQRDWSNIKQMHSVDLYIKRDKSGDIEAYFCYGKGHDLNGIIHEIATSFEKMDQLIESLQSYKLWLPEIYNQHFKRDQVMYCAFFRVGNRKLFSDFINSWSRGEVTLLMQDGQNVTFSHKNISEHQASEEDFLNYIFGPNPLTEFQDYGRPLYISGLDSV